MALKLITAPAAEPILAADIYSRLGIRSADVEPADLDALITSARTWIEGYLGRALISQTWELALGAFPAGAIELHWSPVSSIVSVTYTDSNGVSQVLASSAYTLDDYGIAHSLRPAYGTEWPSTADTFDAVKVRYVAGYGASGADVPAPIVQALVMMVGQSYRAQPGMEASLYPTGIPNAAKELLAPYRLISF